VLAVRDGESRARRDRLAGEEPLEIRAGGPSQDPVAVTVTMRTPGHDFELAAGLLFAEGLIERGDIASISYCDDLDDDQKYNVVTIRLTHAFDFTPRRNWGATSACGVCGAGSIEDVQAMCVPVSADVSVPMSVVLGAPDILRGRQRVFDRTGGLHGAALIDAGGQLLVVREDIGRHNAVDKVVGATLLGSVPSSGPAVLAVSGRAGFEIVQKAARAQIPVLCAVSAPSSLAVRTAEELGITLAAFVRDGRANVYSHPGRLAATENFS
jgi:FdhD protein